MHAGIQHAAAGHRPISVARHVENGDAAAHGGHAFGQLAAGDAGHDDVGQQEVDRVRMLGGQPLRFFSAGRGKHAITIAAQRRGRHMADLVLIFHQ